MTSPIKYTLNVSVFSSMAFKITLELKKSSTSCNIAHLVKNYHPDTLLTELHEANASPK